MGESKASGQDAEVEVEVVEVGNGSEQAGTIYDGGKAGTIYDGAEPGTTTEGGKSSEGGDVEIGSDDPEKEETIYDG